MYLLKKMIDSLLSLWYNKTTLKKGGCRMIKKFIMSLFSIIGISCIVYYTSKYYIERQLCFTDNMLIPWTIISYCVIVALIVGLFSLWKVDKIERQNNEMKSILLKLTEDSEEYYDSLCHHLQNSRELSFDIFDKMQERS